MTIKICEVVVTISDTGKGIDSDIMPRLFSKFVSKSDAGTGLGSVYFKKYNRSPWWKNVGSK